MSGEYFLTQEQKETIQKESKLKKWEAKMKAKAEEKAKDYEAPEEPMWKRTRTEETVNTKPDVQALKKKFLKKR